MIELTIDNEFKELLPPLSDEKRRQLEENLLRDGVREPLAVWNGILIDGHNRYEIAMRHGLTFTTVEMQFDSRDAVKIWMADNQFGRRDLTVYERSLLAIKIKPSIAAIAKERQGERNDLNIVKNSCQSSEEPAPAPKPKSARENKTDYQVAQKAGVSEDTIRKVEKIEAQATPEIKAALKSGDISINQAFKTVKQQEKETRQEERRERKFYTPPTELPQDACQLFCADIREGLPQIADKSVDFIITDPPYPKEFLPLYADLSKVAARVLKDGGSLVCMAGQSYLPDVIQLLATKLNYQWCLCYLTPGQKTQIWDRHVQAVWKPLLWFVKGKHTGDWLGVDAVTSGTRDKNFHEWGQSLDGMKGIIERFTNPDDVVLDPFLGGGTTGVVALSCKRKFIGADIEQKNIDTTQARITEEFANDT